MAAWLPIGADAGGVPLAPRHRCYCSNRPSRLPARWSRWHCWDHCRRWLLPMPPLPQTDRNPASLVALLAPLALMIALIHPPLPRRPGSGHRGRRNHRSAVDGDDAPATGTAAVAEPAGCPADAAPGSRRRRCRSGCPCRRAAELARQLGSPTSAGCGEGVSAADQEAAVGVTGSAVAEQTQRGRRPARLQPASSGLDCSFAPVRGGSPPARVHIRGRPPGSHPWSPMPTTSGGRRAEALTAAGRPRPDAVW